MGQNDISLGEINNLVYIIQGLKKAVWNSIKIVNSKVNRRDIENEKKKYTKNIFR